MSLTREEKLVILVEECAEVIRAVTKIQRFGWDNEQDGYGVNSTVISLVGRNIHSAFKDKSNG